MTQASSDFRTCREEFRCNDDGFFTFTSTEQKRVEDLVEDQVKGYGNTDQGDVPAPVLHRSLHVDYLTKALRECGRGYSGFGCKPFMDVLLGTAQLEYTWRIFAA
ncbi:hypothetical protein OSTOST_18628 [Ostertagia ostertagi]